MKSTLSHAYDIPPEQLWRTMFDAALVEKIYRLGLEVHDFTLLENDLRSRVWCQRARIVPNLTGIGQLSALLGKQPSFETTIRYDRVRQRCTGLITPSLFAEQFRLDFSIEVEPSAGAGCVRTVRADAQSRLFAVSRLVERSALNMVERFFDEANRLYLLQRDAVDELEQPRAV